MQTPPSLPPSLLQPDRAPAHHGDENGESGKDLWPEPVGRLHILLLLQDWVVDKELLASFLDPAVSDVALDLLLKLGPRSFLQSQRAHTLNLLHSVSVVILCIYILCIMIVRVIGSTLLYTFAADIRNCCVCMRLGKVFLCHTL